MRVDLWRSKVEWRNIPKWGWKGLPEGFLPTECWCYTKRKAMIWVATATQTVELPDGTTERWFRGAIVIRLLPKSPQQRNKPGVEAFHLVYGTDVPNQEWVNISLRSVLVELGKKMQRRVLWNPQIQCEHELDHAECNCHGLISE